MKSIYSFRKRECFDGIYEFVIMLNLNDTGMVLKTESAAKKYCEERNKTK